MTISSRSGKNKWKVLESSQLQFLNLSTIPSALLQLLFLHSQALLIPFAVRCHALAVPPHHSCRSWSFTDFLLARPHYLPIPFDCVSFYCGLPVLSLSRAWPAGIGQGNGPSLEGYQLQNKRCRVTAWSILHGGGKEFAKNLHSILQRIVRSCLMAAVCMVSVDWWNHNQYGLAVKCSNRD